MSDLQDGWEWTTLGDIAEVAGGVTKDSKKQADPLLPEVPYLRVANVQRGYLDLQNVATIRVPKATLQKLRLLPGDILFNEGGDRDKLGRGWVWEGQVPDCIHQNHVFRARIRPDEYDPKFISMYGNSLGRKWFEDHGKQTVNLASISLSTLKAFPVPRIPLYGQQRIVAAIEEQFSRIDAGIASLARVKEKCRKVRDLLPIALLSRGSASDPIESLPWVKLSEISKQIVDCPHSTPKFLPNGMPCIDTTCISPGVIHRERLRYVDPSSYEERIRRLTPQLGDLIFAREGTVGTTVMVPVDLRPCLGQRVMLFRPDLARVRSDYLCLVMNSELVKKQYRSKLLGSTVPHLNVRDAKELAVPVPPLELQADIAGEADRITSILDETEKAIEASLESSSSLRSSILDAAFSGKLTSQGVRNERQCDHRSEAVELLQCAAR